MLSLSFYGETIDGLWIVLLWRAICVRVLYRADVLFLFFCVTFQCVFNFQFCYHSTSLTIKANA